MTTPVRTVSLRCACGHALAVTEDRVGTKVACPKCGTLIPVRAGAQREEVPSIAPRVVRPDEVGKLCAICQGPFVPGVQVVACDACALPFHPECWQENGGCGTYGCTRMPKTVKAPGAGTAATAGWGDVKTCPQCRREIKSMALKCRWCGASFESADPLTSDDFRATQASRREMASARSRALLLFFLSLVACIAPVMVVVDWIWVISNRRTLRRIPGPHLVLGWAACAISTFYCLLMAVLLVVDSGV